jgi:hypothetical protein
VGLRRFSFSFRGGRAESDIGTHEWWALETLPPGAIATPTPKKPGKENGRQGAAYNAPILNKRNEAFVLLFVSILKALSEILAFSLIGQGILYVIAGQRRESNFVYRMFATITRPVLRLSRLITPRFVLDRHIWMVAVLLVFALWVYAGQQKLRLCVHEASHSPLCVEMVQTLKEQTAPR